MAWLVSEARVLASAEMATDRGARRRGLLGRDSMEGALVIAPCRWIHTMGMRFPIDVAYLDADGVVVKTIHMHRNRVGIPVGRARTVIEAEGGAFGRWGLRVGDVIEVRTDDEQAEHERSMPPPPSSTTPSPPASEPASAPPGAPTAGSPPRPAPPLSTPPSTPPHAPPAA